MALPLPAKLAITVGACLLSSMSLPAYAQSLAPQSVLNAAASVGGDEVGRSVVMNNTTVFAGAPGFVGTGNSFGTVFTWRRQGTSGWTPSTRISPPHPEDEQFGQSLALDNETLAIGAPSSTTQLPQTGAVEVFARSNTQNWTPVARVVAQDGEPGDEFGHAVALDDQTMVVGAPGESSLGPSAGAVYVFERNRQTGAWIQVARLIAPNGEDQDRFGEAVAIDQDRIVVGAPGQDGLQPPGAPIPASDAGRVYVFEKSASSWSLTKQLVITDPGPGDQLGMSVQVIEDTILAGAPGVDTLQPGQNPPFIANTGAIFEYSKQGTRWRQRQILRAPQRRTNENLGAAIAMTDTHLLAGTSYKPNGDSETGMALLWTRTEPSTAWNFSGKLEPSRPSDTWGHGESVFLFQDQALVGAPFAVRPDGSQEDAGAISVYQIPDAVPAPVLPGSFGWLTLCAMSGWVYRRRSA